MKFSTNAYTCDCYQEYRNYFLVIQTEREQEGKKEIIKIYKIKLSLSQYGDYRNKLLETHKLHKNNLLLNIELENTVIGFLSALNSTSKNLAALKEDPYFKEKIAARENHNRMFRSQSEAKAGEPLSQSSQVSLSPSSRTERAKLVVNAEANASVPASAPAYWVSDKMLPHRNKSQSLYDASQSQSQPTQPQGDNEEATQPQAMDIDAGVSAAAPVADHKASAVSASASAAAVDTASYNLFRTTANNYIAAQKLKLRIPSEAKSFFPRTVSAASPAAAAASRSVSFSRRTPSLLGKRKREKEEDHAEVLTPRAAARAAGS